MFSLGSPESPNWRLMAPVEKMNGHQYLHYEVQYEDYSLKLTEKPTGIPESMKDDPVVQFIMEHPFNKDTKFKYYSVLDHYGTHFVTKVTLGAKALLRWSFQENPEKDTLNKISKVQKIKDNFQHALDEWRSHNYSIPEKREVKLPKIVNEFSYKTNNFGLDAEERKKKGELVAFRVEEISTLFPVKMRSNMEMAIRAYLEEMRPRRSVEDLKDGQVVAIYCLDKRSFLGVDEHGHLKVTNSAKIHETMHKFEVKRKGHRVGLKSLLYSHKLLSRAMTKSVFHFHRLQYMGPHESFEVDGEYILACGSLHAAVVLYVGEDGQVHHDGKAKNRMVFLDVSARDPTHELQQYEIKEPVYFEDMHVEIKFTPAPATDPLPRPGELGLIESEHGAISPRPLSDFHKSNSTSSLYIKETISLPNVDELTKRIAMYLHELTVQGHHEQKPNFIDLLDEAAHPLTRHAAVNHIPSIETVYHFLNTIFKVEKLSPEPGIMALVYLNRMKSATGLTMHARTWRRAILCCLILSSKVWEDLAVWNVDFLELFPNVTVKDLNNMERFLLESMEFNVTIKASQYVKMFFELAQYASIERGVDEKPMDSAALEKLEVRTANSEKEYFAHMMVKKSVSLANFSQNEIQESKRNHMKGGRGILS